MNRFLLVCPGLVTTDQNLAKFFIWKIAAVTCEQQTILRFKGVGYFRALFSTWQLFLGFLPLQRLQCWRCSAKSIQHRQRQKWLRNDFLSNYVNTKTPSPSDFPRMA